MRRILWGLTLTGFLTAILLAQEKPVLSPLTKNFVTVDSRVVALAHVMVIDGTGATPSTDQTITIENGVIREIGPSASLNVPAGPHILDMTGRSAIPGLVGMHDHMFYPTASGQGPVQGAPALYGEMGFSFPRLYLAGGVTTIRTAGSIEPYTDLALKKMIDNGKMPGPKMHITRAELGAAIKAAHARGIKVTGHLCSVGFSEAAELGIDDLEHGLVVDQEFNPKKEPDVCPPDPDEHPILEKLDVESKPVQEMIRKLVQQHVAVTSTLVIFETFVANRPPLQDRVMQAMSLPSRADYLAVRTKIAEGNGSGAMLLKKEMQFEHDFVHAGGLLISGEDPTGYGGVLAGFGDQRQTELLVEAGFTPLEAIHIATQNGAEFLGESDRIGTLKPGKQADIVVVKGDPSQRIADLENVELVFKDGIGYDPQKLIRSVQAAVGLH